ncbi:hypothetical protein KQH50_03235 [bacterium]|nr:hypothetical protein [bacterium]
MSTPTSSALQTYQKYYIDRDNEQVDLFRLLKTEYGIASAVYPGSFVQVSPSFIFPRVVYIDSDKGAIRFFKTDAPAELIEARKEYPEETEIAFHGIDYRELIEDYRLGFDLLISQYAGFISDACKPYLKPGGYLLVNNSHADAGLASLDPDYELVAAIHRREGKYRLSTWALDEYFIPKKGIRVTRELLLERGKGVGYIKTAPLYLFRRADKII